VPDVAPYRVAAQLSLETVSVKAPILSDASTSDKVHIVNKRPLPSVSFTSHSTHHKSFQKFGNHFLQAMVLTTKLTKPKENTFNNPPMGSDAQLV